MQFYRGERKVEKEGGKERKVKEEGWKHHNIYQTLFSSYFSVGHPWITILSFPLFMAQLVWEEVVSQARSGKPLLYSLLVSSYGPAQETNCLTKKGKMFPQFRRREVSSMY